MARNTGEEPRAGTPIDDYITGPFTKNIDDYLDWLEGKIGPFDEIASRQGPRRLAGLAVSLYKPKYQVSPERRAARGVRNTGEEPRGGKTIDDYITGRFTEMIDDYLDWLEDQLEGKIGTFDEIASRQGPRRLAGLAITLHRKYPGLAKRRAARAGK